MAFCAFNFGYDVGTFSGVQAMQPFARQFGHYDEEEGEYLIAGWLRSVMTATPFIGKALVYPFPDSRASHRRISNRHVTGRHLVWPDRGTVRAPCSHSRSLHCLFHVRLSFYDFTIDYDGLVR